MNVTDRQWSALHLRLNLMSYGRPQTVPFGNSPVVALYNWTTGSWDSQPGFTQGVHTVASPAAYLDRRGLVRVQLNGSNGQQLQTLDIALDGRPS
jgi:hypothetical protein